MSAAPVPPGTRYGPWETVRPLASGGHLARCTRCGRLREMTTRVLCIARQRGYRGCEACKQDSAEERAAGREERRERIRQRMRRVWTGAEWLTEREAAERLGVTRQRVNQLVHEHDGDLAFRFVEGST